MNREEAQSYIFELYEAACIELFQSMGCEVSWATAEEFGVENTPIASIDAGSEDLEIKLILHIPFPALALTYPVLNVFEVDDNQLEDWLAEISNQLIGRMKSKLIKHECFVQIGLPESFFGINPQELIPEGYACKSLFFHLDSEVIECQVYINMFNDNIDLNIREDETADVLDEGGIELF